MLEVVGGYFLGHCETEPCYAHQGSCELPPMGRWGKRPGRAETGTWGVTMSWLPTLSVLSMYFPCVNQQINKFGYVQPLRVYLSGCNPSLLLLRILLVISWFCAYHGRECHSTSLFPCPHSPVRMYLSLSKIIGPIITICFLLNKIRRIKKKRKVPFVTL